MDLQISQVTDAGSTSAVRDRLLTERLLAIKDECYASEFHRDTQKSFFDTIECVREAFPDWETSVTSYATTEAIFTLKGTTTFFVLYSGDRFSGRDPWTVQSRHISVEGYGDKSILRTIQDRLAALFPISNFASLVWEFSTARGRESRNLQLGAGKPTHAAFYPFLAPDLTTYQSNYLGSDSSVLILLGPPGGGKTSFIRDMIHRHSLKTTFTYDEQLLDSDDLFVSFISGDQDLLVVEDADTFLTDRERGGNQKMARFLNVSDGLAAPAHPKKIIFTANISNKNQIDAALLRPGRCFDCQVFRKLSFREAVEAANVAGLPPRLVEDRDYSLAEIFALSKGESVVALPGKFGVVR